MTDIEPRIKIKKYNVAHNELFLKGKNGLYCLLPFERLDSKKKAIFKVGMTSQDLAIRIENYHTYFPLGLYVVMFLAYPRLKQGQDRNKLYRDMEKNSSLILNLQTLKCLCFRPVHRNVVNGSILIMMTYKPHLDKFKRNMEDSYTNSHLIK